VLQPPGRDLINGRQRTADDPERTSYRTGLAQSKRPSAASTTEVISMACDNYAAATIGYARVSTDGQSLDGQLLTLKQHGASVIFREKISGARSDRKQLQ
jgi:hypothetical protein